MDKSFEFVLYYRTRKVKNEEGKRINPTFGPNRISDLERLGFRSAGENSNYYKREFINAGGKTEAMRIAQENAQAYSAQLTLPLEYRISMTEIPYDSAFQTTV